MKKRRTLISDREREKIKRRNRRKSKDPYDNVRRDAPPVGHPIDTGKNSKKAIRNREKSLIEKGLEEYYNEEDIE